MGGIFLWPDSTFGFKAGNLPGKNPLFINYRLLQAMNLGCAGRYGEMAASAEGLVAFADRLQGQCAELMPQLGRIDAIAQQVHELEGAVGQLDAYSRRLEAKFDALAESAKGKT